MGGDNEIEEYEIFLDNDEQLAEMYGKSMQLFRTNKLEIASDRLQYDFVMEHEIIENSGFGNQIVVTVKNPYQLKIRSEKQIAMVLGLFRS